MKKIKAKTKAFIMVAAMVLMMLLPTKMNAQTKMDGFFANSDSNNYVDRSSGDFVVTNQQFGNNDAPLGNGVIIMIVAGASYVAIRRKKEDRL